VLGEPPGDLFSRPLVRHLRLYAAEASVSGCSEAIEEIVFVEEIVQVSGELRHDVSPNDSMVGGGADELFIRPAYYLNDRRNPRDAASEARQL
jgi:hypothetical protein